MFWFLIKNSWDRCKNCWHRRDEHGTDGYCMEIVEEIHNDVCWDEPCNCPGFRKDWDDND